MVSILATAYFLVAAVGAHFVDTQYNFFSDYISDYAVGPLGWIYGSAFLASCLGCLSLATSLALVVPSEALSRTGAVLLARRHNVCGRPRIPDRHSSPRSAANNNGRRDSFGGRSCRLGALHNWRHLDLGAIETRRLLEDVAADSDNPRLAVSPAPRPLGPRRRFKGAHRGPRREGFHTGPQHLGADARRIGFQGAEESRKSRSAVSGAAQEPTAL